MELLDVKRGAIYWINLNQIEGSEIGKTRPAVIVSNDVNNQFADTVTVVPLTTSTEKIYPFEVLIEKNIGNLKEDSKAKANQIRTVDKIRIGEKIGNLPENILYDIIKAIKIHLNII
jgi:mRNA interferase MazF